MCKNYDECIDKKGRVKTKKIGNNKFVNICYDKKGQEHVSPIFTKKERKQKSKQIEKRREAVALAELNKLRDFCAKNWRCEDYKTNKEADN